MERPRLETASPPSALLGGGGRAPLAGHVMALALALTTAQLELLRTTAAPLPRVLRVRRNFGAASFRLDVGRLATMVSQATRNWPGGAKILTQLFPNPSM